MAPTAGATGCGSLILHTRTCHCFAQNPMGWLAACLDAAGGAAGRECVQHRMFNGPAGCPLDNRRAGMIGPDFAKVPKTLGAPAPGCLLVLGAEPSARRRESQECKQCGPAARPQRGVGAASATPSTRSAPHGRELPPAAPLG